MCIYIIKILILVCYIIFYQHRNKMIRTVLRNSLFANFSTKKTGVVIGIDLGTTNSCVAVM